MNRRDFLKSIVAVPAITLVPSFLLAKPMPRWVVAEKVPTYVVVEDLDLSDFGNRIPEMTIHTSTGRYPAYIRKVYPIVEHIKEGTYWYTATFEIENSLNLPISKFSIWAENRKLIACSTVGRRGR